MYSRNERIVGTEVSPLVQTAVLALRESTDFKLISMLLTEGRMPFSEIKDKLKLEPVVVDRCLKRLMNGALLDNYYAKEKESRAYSFYEVTLLGRDLFASLADLGRPSSAVPKARNPFYQPGPEILDDIQKLSELTKRLQRNAGLMRSAEQ
jgi:DNA-binding Lrp family transcriptional regulator